jgi:hypothetical protein
VYVVDWFKQSVQPFERGKFDSFKGSSWAAPVDHLGVLELVDGLGQSIVIALPTLPTEGSMPASAERSE